jgi:hypothetical protein
VPFCPAFPKSSGRRCEPNCKSYENNFYNKINILIAKIIAVIFAIRQQFFRAADIKGLACDNASIALASYASFQPKNIKLFMRKFCRVR